MGYLLAKALHLVGVVTWFAGLFYIVRLFVYDVEAGERPAGERDILRAQLALMERRLLFGITWPAMALTTVFGLYLLAHYARPFATWLQVKYAFLALLFGYHFSCHRIYRKLRAGDLRLTSGQLRAWNEVATLLLVAIILVAVLKDYALNAWLPIGLSALVLLLAGGMLAYRRLRQK